MQLSSRSSNGCLSESHAFILAGSEVESRLHKVVYLGLISFKDSA